MKMLTELGAKRKAKAAGWADAIVSEADLRAARRGCWYDPAAAERPIHFFRKALTHTQSGHSGKVFEPVPWQSSLLRRLYGWKRPNSLRRFTRALCFIPRRSGKSVFGGGIGLYGLIADNEPSAQVAIVASSIEQAKNIYNSASAMVQTSPELAKRIKTIDSTRRMLHRESMSNLMILTPDFKRARGVGPSLLLFDEIVAQGDDRRLYDVLRYSQSARRQPIALYFSTAGASRDTSLIGELVGYAEQVESGRVDDDNFLPVLYRAPADADPADEAVWKAANPSIGHTITLQSVREEFDDAKTSNRKMAVFRTERLNQFVAAATAYLDVAKWDLCSRRLKSESPHEWRERVLQQAEDELWPLYLGMDLAGSTDTTALVALFRVPDEDAEDGHRYVAVPWCWVPSECQRPNERPAILPLIAEGYIETVDGSWMDFSIVERLVLELRERFHLQELAFDRRFAAGIIQNLIRAGITCTPIAMSYSDLNAPTKELERLVLSGRIDHGGNPAYRWQAENLSVKVGDQGDVYPVKPRSAAKVDAMVATILALARSVVSQPSGLSGAVDDWFVTV